jgi:hypothetical protein
MTDAPTRGPNVYEAFTEELDHMVVAAGDSAVKVVGDLTRAVKRAQMVVDGELPRIRERLGLPAGGDYCKHVWEPFMGLAKCTLCGQLGGQK